MGKTLMATVRAVRDVVVFSLVIGVAAYFGWIRRNDYFEVVAFSVGMMALFRTYDHD